MPKFAANLSLMFNEVPMLERFALAAQAGFRAVELQSPYEFEPDEIAHALEINKLQLILHNLPAGDWTRGERGLGCIPNRVEEFRAGIKQAIIYATALQCPRVNCLAGILPAGVTPIVARKTLIENLRFAARELKTAGVELVLEHINTRDLPSFFVNRTSDALAIIAETGVDNLKLQLDIYHAQVMEGDITCTLAANFARIGHIQIADNPGRHEPGTGEINFPFLFKKLDDLGYEGWVGCEYKPLTTTKAGLHWKEGY